MISGRKKLVLNQFIIVNINQSVDKIEAVEVSFENIRK